jgi:hypothetical protein
MSVAALRVFKIVLVIAPLLLGVTALARALSAL